MSTYTIVTLTWIQTCMCVDALVHVHTIHVQVEHTLVGYTATVHWGVGGGTGVSVG